MAACTTFGFPGRAVLVDRGEPDFEAPVAQYRLEFAANGKVDVRRREARQMAQCYECFMV